MPHSSLIRARAAGRGAREETRRRALIREVARPVRRRRPTQPTRAARQRRMEGKKQRGRVKRLRGRPAGDD
ncbi:hypothetical protein [Alkalilimnicola ehrlichii]|uniref:hypothetical protein n=1 Tax=Alkalilimnicola ehrlichii TaxID=351052 RepID=UPI003BA1D7B7